MILTKETRITAVTPIGSRKTFSVELEHEPRNFLCNGVFMGNSHAISYAYLAYYTLALKMKYPATFLAASMSEMISQSKDGWKDKLFDYFEEARVMGVSILPPSLNDSIDDFSPVEKNKAVRIGLRALTGVGESMAAKFIEARAEGKFKSIFDVMGRGALRSNTLRTLAKIGSLDEFIDVDLHTIHMFDKRPGVRYMNRLIDEKYEPQVCELLGESPGAAKMSWAMKARAIANFDEKQLKEIGLRPQDVVTISEHEVSKREMAWLLVNYYAENTGKRWFRKDPEILGYGMPPKIDRLSALEFEKEALGCYVSGHPMEFVDRPAGAVKIGDMPDGHVCIVGMSARVRKRVSVKGRVYLVGQLVDETGSKRFIVFGSNGIEDKAELFTEGNIVLVRGRSSKGDALKVDYVTKLEDSNGRTVGPKGA